MTAAGPGPGDVAAAPAGGGSVWSRVDVRDAGRVIVVASCAVAVALGLTWPWPVVPVVAVAGLVLGCWPILVTAWAHLRRRRMSMELSMLIAGVAAAAIGQWVTSLVITVFVLAAEILEDLSMDRGRDALTDLMAFLPDRVRVRDGDTVTSVPLGEVRPGQIVIVSPGGRVPVDGAVVAGRSNVDQSRITGESLPVDIGPGDTVFAGSINQFGALEVRAELVGADSSYGRIVEAVRRAQASAAPVQRLADRLAAYVVYFALAGAVVTLLVTRSLTATISVVVVAGACGIAAGTPLAVLAVIGRAARFGGFIKDGAHLEALSTVDTIIFDKTGTITVGAPAVVAVRPAGHLTEHAVLTVAAGAELYSEHPLGQAIVAHARARNITPADPESFRYEPGRGITAQVSGHRVCAGNGILVPDAPPHPNPDGATAVHIGIDGAYAGTILLADTIRDSAPECVADLHRRGLRMLMLTGDQESSARAVAARLGIDDVRAGLLPEDKLAVLDAEHAAGHRIAMIGDGINDAPALGRANVGIAMGSGTEVARESADVVLISSDLMDLARTVTIARRARRVVMFNFIGTLVVDLTGMVAAGFGLFGPVIAALIHVGSETTFILNSARLIPGRRRH